MCVCVSCVKERVSIVLMMSIDVDSQRKGGGV